MKKRERIIWAAIIMLILASLVGLGNALVDNMQRERNRKFDCSKADSKEMSDFMRECVIHSGHNSDKCRRDGNAIYCDEIFNKEPKCNSTEKK